MASTCTGNRHWHWNNHYTKVTVVCLSVRIQLRLQLSVCLYEQEVTGNDSTPAKSFLSRPLQSPHFLTLKTWERPGDKASIIRFLFPRPHPQKEERGYTWSTFWGLLTWHFKSEFCRTNQIHAMWLTVAYTWLSCDTYHAKTMRCTVIWSHDLLHPVRPRKSSMCTRPYPFLLLGVGAGNETTSIAELGTLQQTAHWHGWLWPKPRLKSEPL
jgi:hypothetical protein